MKLKLISFFTVLSLLFVQLVSAENSEKGKITGAVIDSETGDPLIGANIFLENTSIGAASDLDGRFLIMNIPAGSYTLVISVVGYAETKITSVEVKEGEVYKLDISVKPEILSTDEVVVEAKAIKNTEAALLKSRQKSVAVSDAVSAEAISGAGSGNAAEAMKQVTGASVVEGKYVFVRGLGDRYTSTQLNGAEIPSTDPYRRSGSIDLIPSNLIDNIQTIKSFTPDKPGDFSGGAVDIKTKDFPDQLKLSVSTSTSYNSQTNLNDNGPIGYTGGGTDWLGMDDGTRDIPSLLKNKNVYIPNIGESNPSINSANEKLLSSMTNSFNKQFAPTKWTPSLNQSYALSIGNQVNVFNKPLGFFFGVTYKNGASSYDNAKYQRWELSSTDVMTTTYDLKDTQTKSNVNWGGLLKASYKFAPNHKVSFNGMYNQDAESGARYLEGAYPYDLSAGDVFRASVLSYSERNLKTAQLNGEHLFETLFNLKFDWRASLGNTTEEEPDLRYFADSYSTTNGVRTYTIKQSKSPSRYFRDLDENRNDFSADFTLPFKQWSGYNSNLKFGGLSARKERDYAERLFKFVDNDGFADYNGDPNQLLSTDNIGVIDSSKITIRGVPYTTYEWGVVVQENELPKNNYHAEKKISAGYAMLELPILNSLKFVGGARYETTDMSIETNDSTVNGGFRVNDWLPSINLIYSINTNMNIRLAYSQTLARPTFREIGEFNTFDFTGGEVYIGNKDLKRTFIKNYDLRWEWFSRPGEIYAVSLFYKDFSQPIEQIYNLFGENTWNNIDEAKAYGLELEFRKKLDFIHGSLSHFLFGSNLSLIQSEVNIPDDEWLLIKDTRPEADRTRPFQGQSPYLVNANLTYENPELGIVSSIYYNIFGERLDRVSYAATPDVYEKPAGLLNFSFKYGLTKQVDLKFSANNLLNPQHTKYHSYKGNEYIYSQYKKGINYSLGLGYNL